MHGQPLIQEGEIGIDHIADRQIAMEHLLEKEPGFRGRRLGQGIVEIIVVV